MSLATIRQAIKNSTMSQADKDAALNGIRRAQKSHKKSLYFRPDAGSLSGLFFWSETPEGYSFWSSIDLKLSVKNELAGIEKTMASKPLGLLDLLRY